MKRVICSVYPKDLTERRNYRTTVHRNATNPGGFSTTFVMEAAPREGYSLLTIEDMEQSDRYMSDAPVQITRVYADGPGGVADDLVNAWTGHVTGEAAGGPGVFICTELDEKDTSGEILNPAIGPGPNELAAARRKQSRWFTWLEMDADSKWINGRRGEIFDQHRMAAEWLGHTNPKVHPWLIPQDEQERNTSCPLCRTSIQVGTVICPNCKNVIDHQAFADYQQNSARIEAQVKKMNAEILAESPELAQEQAAAAADIGVKVDPLASDSKDVQTIVALAKEVFGDDKKAADFMTRTHVKLHGKTPLAAAQINSAAAEKVMDILNAIKGPTVAA